MAEAEGSVGCAVEAEGGVAEADGGVVGSVAEAEGGAVGSVAEAEDCAVDSEGGAAGLVGRLIDRGSARRHG
ncbi:hypothetical protein LZ199_28865 [Myxococcus sp. QH3KD-4-1]|nr:hypothetical protein [Myxococcus qinghaiensis]